jgi:hypothetical protein
MVDSGVAIGAIVALGGVGLGSWMTGRLQRKLLQEQHLREDRQSREDAYVAVLVAFRKFRVFLTSESPTVRLGPPSRFGGQVPVIEGGKDYLDAVQEALARLAVLEGSTTPMIDAANTLERTFLDLAKTRADHPPGTVSEAELLVVRTAEAAYVDTAHRHLKHFDSGGPAERHRPTSRLLPNYSS